MNIIEAAARAVEEIGENELERFAAEQQQYQCVFIDAHDGTGECYQCGTKREVHQ